MSVPCARSDCSSSSSEGTASTDHVSERSSAMRRDACANERERVYCVSFVKSTKLTSTSHARRCRCGAGSRLLVQSFLSYKIQSLHRRHKHHIARRHNVCCKEYVSKLFSHLSPGSPPAGTTPPGGIVGLPSFAPSLSLATTSVDHASEMTECVSSP